MIKGKPDWKIEGNYHSRKEADAEDHHHGMWYMKDRCVLKEMVVERYYCKNKDSKGCLAQKSIYVLFRDASCYVKTAFSHKDVCLEKKDEPADFKGEIIGHYNSGYLQPWAIRHKMGGNEREINITKVYQTLYRHKKGLLNGMDVTSSKVIELCEEFNRTQAVSDRGDKKGYVADIVLEQENVKILITAPNLLILLSEADNVHIDATYKVIDAGYPVVVLGITDADQKFVLVALSIVSDEKMETYLWILNVLRRECEKYALIFKPKNLIADLAPQISQAIHQFEPSSLRTHCWVHVLRGMRKLTKDLVPCLKEDIMSDIFFLQLINTKALFEKGWALFLEKWQQMRQTEECVSQLNQNYYLNNGNWYEGYAVHSSSTNNALERFNLTIKTRYTNWGRMNVLEFIRLGIAAVEDSAFTIEKVSLKRQYNEAAICHDDYSNGMVFKQLGTVNGYINYVFSGVSEADKEKDESLSRRLENLDFSMFKEFKELLSKTVIVSAKSDIQSLMDVFCSCRNFVKGKKCWHVYTFLTRLGKKELLNSELMFVKNKRGRPRSVKKNTGLLKE